MSLIASLIVPLFMEILKWVFGRDEKVKETIVVHEQPQALNKSDSDIMRELGL